MKNPYRSVVSVIAALFGVKIALMGAGDLVHQLRTARWPVTTGTLLSAEVGTRTTTNSKGGASTMYYKKVSYTYTLGGQAYQGVTYRPPADESNDQSSLRSTHQAQVDTLWQQQKTQGHINVHYNPGNSSQSALDVRASPFGVVFLSLGLVLLLGLLGLASPSRRRRIVFLGLAFGCGAGVPVGFFGVLAGLSAGLVLVLWGDCLVASCVVALWLANTAQGSSKATPSKTPLPVQGPRLEPVSIVTTTPGLAAPPLSPGGTVSLESRRMATRVGFIVGLVVFLPFAGVALFASYLLSGGWSFHDKALASFHLFFAGAVLVSIGGSGVVAALLAGAFTASLINEINGPKAMWKACDLFAQQMGGVLRKKEGRLFGLSWSQHRGVAFSHGGTDVLLDVQTTGFRRYKTHYSRLTYALPSPTPFRCHLYPQGLVAKFGTALGMQDARLGWQDFDDQFVVEVSDEGRARVVLSNEVQSALLGLKQWYRSDVDLTVEQALLRVRVTGYLSSQEDLHTFAEFGGRIYDEIQRTLQSCS